MTAADIGASIVATPSTSGFLGREPVYSSARGLSRDFLDVLDGAEPDPLGAAQYLTLGFPIGGRTVFKGVSRLPGEMPNLDDKHRDGPIKRNAEELAALFSRACKGLAGRNNVVSLSGGLDSRAVVAGLGDTNYRLATFANPSADKDVAVAKLIAEAVGRPHEVVPVGPPSAENIERLLELTHGQNYALMAFILPFFDSLLAKGQMTYFTGDGGDKAMPPLTTGRKPRDNREICRFIFSTAIFHPHRACEIAGVSYKALENSVIDVLDSYPERIERRFAKFLISERIPGFIASGEERNRKFFNQASPFMDEAFFRAAMSIPDRQKQRMELYREFLIALSPGLAGIPYANTGSAITSAKFKRRERFREALFSVANPIEIKAKLMPRKITLATDPGSAPGLNLAGFTASPEAYSRNQNAAWWAYTLAWAYRRYAST